jgi:hypothetical protein
MIDLSDYEAATNSKAIIVTHCAGCRSGWRGPCRAYRPQACARSSCSKAGIRGQGRDHPAADRRVGPAPLRGLADRGAHAGGKGARFSVALPQAPAARLATSRCSIAAGMAACWSSGSRALRARPNGARGYDEINAFEDGLAADGTTLVKLFVHITQKEQDKRLTARLDIPWKRWKSDADDFRNRGKRPAYLKAMTDMFAHRSAGKRRGSLSTATTRRPRASPR